MIDEDIWLVICENCGKEITWQEKCTYDNLCKKCYLEIYKKEPWE